MSGVLLADRYLTPMTEADLDEVAAVEKLAYEFPWSRGNFQDSLRNGYFGVCLRHVTGTLIGYCVLMPVVDEMHLLNLCVAPPAQRAGAGLTLLREAVRITRRRSSTACCWKCGRRIRAPSSFTSALALSPSGAARTITPRGIVRARTQSSCVCRFRRRARMALDESLIEELGHRTGLGAAGGWRGSASP